MRTTAAQELAAVDLGIGLAAVAGGVLLAVCPDGSLLGMSSGLLGPTPFTDYRLPGLLLAGVVGGSNLIAGLVAWRAPRFAGIAGLVAVTLLLGWMSVQVELIGYCHWSQGVYLCLGMVSATLDVVVVMNAPAPKSPQLAVRLSISGGERRLALTHLPLARRRGKAGVSAGPG
jgi:hypothetical protein